MTPQITIDKSGPDGNIFAIIGKALRVLRMNGMKKEAEALEKRILEAMKEVTMDYASACMMIEEYIDIKWI